MSLKVTSNSNLKLKRKRESLAWSRHGLYTTTIEERDNTLRRIESLIQAGGKLGVHFIVGCNSIQKLMEKGCVSMIFICRDTPQEPYNFLVESAKVRKIPSYVLPKSANILARTVGLKKASCLALPTSEAIEKHHSSSSCYPLMLLSMLDGIRDLPQSYQFLESCVIEETNHTVASSPLKVNKTAFQLITTVSGHRKKKKKSSAQSGRKLKKNM
mmetsp:Transcript_15675/g.15805  ORF Transcript_15675/g.15805 Transcript_15675/m.15805 type:complete len:214 (+) Transcript_15675:73-714(+)